MTFLLIGLGLYALVIVGACACNHVAQSRDFIQGVDDYEGH